MSTVHLVVGVSLVTLFAAAGALGGWRWYRVEPSARFWFLLRAAQVTLVVQVLLGGLLVVLGRKPDDDLHYVYGLLGLPISFVAEQLRIGSAESILEARGYESAQDVRTLPAEEQRSIVLAIVRREMGVMALSALVIAGLAIRAATTSGGL